jgi:hypothetical protein
VQRGWIPEWLPRSARSLREAHDHDSNQSVLSFRYDRGEQFPIPPHCAPVRPAEVRQPPLKVSWWPKGVPPGAFVTPGHAFFSCGNGGVFVALSANGEEAYYWRP